MRLEVAENGGFFQHMEALADADGVRLDIETAAGAGSGALEASEIGAILRLLIARIEPNAELNVIGDLLADSMVVNVPPHSRTGQNQLAGLRPVDVIVLADGPFHQHATLVRSGVVAGVALGVWIVLDQVRQRVVRDLAALRRTRPHL